MTVIVIDTQEDLVPIRVVVRLPDVVEGGVRLLRIPWAELIKERSNTNGVARRMILELIAASMLVELVLAEVKLKSGQSRLIGPS